MKFSPVVWQYRWQLIAVSLALVVLSATITFLVLSPDNSLPATTNSDVVTQNLQAVEIEEQPINLAQKTSVSLVLLGYGGAGHQGGQLADAIQFIKLDFDKQQLTMISIPRDLWVSLPNGTQAKINQALTLGADRSQPILSGAKVAKKMVEVVTGQEIDYFVAVDFVGFKRVIGEDLGGITVDVPETVEDHWYPIAGQEQNLCGKSPSEVTELSAQLSGFELEKQFECRYEHIYFPAGLNQMQGGDALAYVRSRHGSASGDFSRSQRQQALLTALKNKMFELEFWQNLPAIWGKLSKNVTTDLDLETVNYFLPALKLAQHYQLKTGTISSENVLMSSTAANGAYILLPRAGHGEWTTVHQFVEQVLE